MLTANARGVEPRTAGLEARQGVFAVDDVLTKIVVVVVIARVAAPATTRKTDPDEDSDGIRRGTSRGAPPCHNASRGKPHAAGSGTRRCKNTALSLRNRVDLGAHCGNAYLRSVGTSVAEAR